MELAANKTQMTQIIESQQNIDSVYNRLLEEFSRMLTINDDEPAPPKQEESLDMLSEQMSSLSYQNAPTLKDLPQILNQLSTSDNLGSVYNALVGLKKLTLQTSQPEIQEAVINSGAIITVVNLLKSSSDNAVKTEAILVLINIGMGPTQNVEYLLLKCEVLPLLIALLDSTNDEVRINAVWGINIFAAYSLDISYKILESGALTKIIKAMKEINVPKFWTNAILLFENLSKGAFKQSTGFDILGEAMGVLCKALNQDVILKDEKAPLEILVTISILVAKNYNCIYELILEGGLKKIISFIDISIPNKQLIWWSMKIISLVAKRDNDTIDIIMEEDPMPKLLKIMELLDDTLISMAFRTIAHLVKGKPIHLDYVLVSIDWPNLFQFTFSLDNADLKKRLLKLIHCLTQCAHKGRLNDMVEIGFVEALSELMGIDRPQDLVVVLETLQIYFEKTQSAVLKFLFTNGPKKIIELKNNQMDEKVQHILNKLLFFTETAITPEEEANEKKNMFKANFMQECSTNDVNDEVFEEEDPEQHEDINEESMKE
jgi:hypothetical protein